MKKPMLAVLVAVVAIAAIAGVVLMQKNKDDNKLGTASTSQESNQDSSSENASDAPATNSPPTSQNPSTSGATDEVEIEDFAFNPSPITVKKGTKVTWTNKDTAEHTVTGTSGGPDSGLFGKGESYSFTFNEVGAFSYFCEPHPHMTGTVIVTE